MFSYSYSYSVLVLFPLYFLINLATVYKIKNYHSDDFNVSDAQSFAVMSRIVLLSIVILYSHFLMDIDKAELFLKSYLIKNQQKQLTNVFNNHMDGIILCRRDDNQPIVEEENGADQEKATGSKKIELVFELCNQAITKVLGFTPTP